MKELYQAVEKLFAAYHYPAHDFQHALRVSRLARKIAESVSYDPQEAEIAGLLHDVGRTIKDIKDSHAHDGAPLARELLDKYTDFSVVAKDRIEQAIYLHSDEFTTGELNNI